MVKESKELRGSILNSVIILAGGKGSRTNLDVPKQYYLVKDKPVIFYTLEKFQNSPSVDCIYVVCSDKWKDWIINYNLKYRITKLAGFARSGETGLLSLLNGVNILKEEIKADDLVIVHDSVRPFIDEDIIEKNIRVAKKYGNAMTSVDCVETLVYSEDGVSSKSLIPRNGIKRIQTPQTFKFADIYKLLSETNLDLCNDPSAFSLWMNKGYRIYCSQGNEKNIKITFSEDIEYFKKLFG